MEILGDLAPWPGRNAASATGGRRVAGRRRTARSPPSLGGRGARRAGEPPGQTPDAG